MSTRYLLLFALSALGSPLAAQNNTDAHSDARLATRVRPVSLEDAIRLADRSSESVEIARAAVRRANGQQLIARSQFLPQLNVSGAYAKTLKSQFSGLTGGGGGGDTTMKSLCAPFVPAGSTAAQRQAAIDQSQSCQQGSGGGGIDFSKAGFGAKNQWSLGLQFSQNLFTGGRASGQRLAANSARRASDIELTAQRAQLILDVTQMYYNTVLAARLTDIAEAALTWNDEVLRQTTQARQVGSSSEFDLLRAQVARDNQVPVVLQRRSDRTIAMLRLKQLLELPLDDSLQLTTSIDDAAMPTVAGVSLERAGATPDTSVADRATVRQANENVKAQEGLLRAARADRFPTIALTSGYQRLFFPATTFPQINDFRENWTVGISAGVSLLSGGRTHGSEMVAEANLREARARLKQAREFAALDSRIALSQLEQAEATWRASQGTAEQARRAYSIDQIRYKEGISTQTDLTQSQLLVEQAMVNRAVAARDLAVARMRLALLKDLPLTAGAGASGGSTNVSGGTGNVLSPPPQQPRTTSTSSTTGSNQQ
jgi:outer membrane protein